MQSTNIHVAFGVKIILPEVLIDYLCNLVSSDENIGYGEQAFELTADLLSGRSIQNIFHGEKRHRVFGFEPVNCILHIVKSPDRYTMMLAS